MPLYRYRGGAFVPIIPPVGTPPPPPPPVTTFTHPGVMYSQPQLDYTKRQLAAGAAPHTQAYTNMLAAKALYGNNAGQPYSSPSWTPRPHSTVTRTGGPEVADNYDLVDDLHAALIHALMWCYKGNRADAQKTVEILNAWATTFTAFTVDPSQGQKLLASWTGTMFARAAELIRYTYIPGATETGLNLTAIKNVLNNIWWPILYAAHSGPAVNWYMGFADSMTQIAVFLDDQTKFTSALNYMRQVLPGVAYLTSDNNPYAWAHPAGGTLTYSNGDVLQCPNGLPMVAKSVFAPATNVYDKTSTSPQTFMENQQAWFHPLSLPNGLWGEVGRDFTHTGMGYAAFGNCCETAWIQGVDLYGELQARIVPSIELQTGFIYETFVGGSTKPTNWPFSKPSNANSYVTSTQRATFEILHHHYVVRKGLSMPNLTKYMTDYARSSSFDVDLMINSETLTHYGNV